MELGPIQTKWIESLEQHPERQRSGELGRQQRDGSYTACCLGEGGLIAGICEWDNEGRLKTIEGDHYGVLYSNAHRALGLREADGSAHANGLKSLVTLNDKKLPWPEIAKILRENTEAYFIESI